MKMYIYIYMKNSDNLLFLYKSPVGLFKVFVTTRRN